MTIVRKSLIAVAVVLIVAVFGISWVVATDSGTRWLLNRAASGFPDQLTLSEVSGSLSRGVTLDSLRWRDDSLDVNAESLYVDIRLLPLIRGHVIVEQLDVERVAVAMSDGEEVSDDPSLPEIELPVDLSVASSSVRNLTITGNDFDRSIDEISAVAAIRGSDLSVGSLSVRSLWLDLDASGALTLSGDYEGDLSIDWAWKDSAVGPFSGALGIDGDIQSYSITHRLETPVTVTTSGTITDVLGEIDLDLLSEWMSVEWSSDGRSVTSSGGTLRLDGRLDEISAELDAQVRIDDLPDTQIRVEGIAGPEAFDLSSLGIQNTWGSLAADGELRWLPERVFDVGFAATGLDPSMLYEQAAGTIDITGTAAGALRGEEPDINVQIQQVQGLLGDSAVDGSGAVRLAGDQLTLTETLLQVGGNRISVDGTIGDSVSVSGEIDADNLADVIADGAGSIRGTFSVGGQLEQPELSLDLRGNSLSWRDYALGSISADARLSGTDEGTVNIDVEQIDVGDTSFVSASLTVSGRIDDHDIKVRLDATEGNAQFQATGGYREDAWAGDIDSLTVDTASFDRWSTSGASRLVIGTAQSSLSSTCLIGAEPSHRLCLEGETVSGGRSAFEVNASGIPVSLIPVPLPADLTLHGFLHADLSGDWQGGLLNATSRVELRDGALNAVYEDELVSLALSTAVGELDVTSNSAASSVSLASADGASSGTLRLAINDITDTLSAIEGQATLSTTDASTLAALVPGVTEPSGKIDGNLTIAGNLGAPEFLGEIALTEGSFGVRQSGIDITDLDVRLTQSAPGFLSLRGSARSGDGELSIEGQTRIGADVGVRSEIRLTGDNFELARLPDWRVAASPAITVVFDDRIVTVEGELAIPSANIVVKDIPEAAVRPSPDAVVQREEAPEPERNMRINVDVQTELGDDVSFAGFGLSTGLEGAVQLRGGSHEAWTGQGRLGLRDGRYKAYGQELEIEQGELIFNGPLDNPQLSVRATRRIDNIVAGINVAGTPSRLRSDVFSEPAMSDAETLSYLLTGRPLARASESGDGNALNNAAFALGLTGAGSITTEIRTSLGLETLAFEGGGDDSRLIAGKRFGDRLLVEYGYGLIDKLGTLLLRYQLTDRIVLESRTGTVSNLDILYNVKK